MRNPADASFDFGANLTPDEVQHYESEMATGSGLDPQASAILQAIAKTFGADQTWTRRQLAQEASKLVRGVRGGRLRLATVEIESSKALAKLLERDHARVAGHTSVSRDAQGRPRAPAEKYRLTETGLAAAIGDRGLALQAGAETALESQIARLEAAGAVRPTRAAPAMGPVYRPVIHRVGGSGHKLPERVMKRIRGAGYRVRYNPKGAYPWGEKQAQYEQYTDAQLAYALEDARAAIQAFRGTPDEGWYYDDVSTIRQEMLYRQDPRKMAARRRKAMKEAARETARRLAGDGDGEGRHENPGKITSVNGLRQGYLRMQVSSGMQAAQFNALVKSALRGKRDPKPMGYFLAATRVVKAHTPAKQPCGCRQGIYDHPGAPMHRGELCYFCGGKGYYTPEDIVRGGWWQAYSTQNAEDRRGG